MASPNPPATPKEDAEFASFCRRVYTLTGIDLASYKSNQMRRRIKSMAARDGAAGFEEFAGLLESDPEKLNAFLDKVTINVSELFRNPEKFDQLRDDFLGPMARQNQALKIWSAGCSYGAEIYSVAMILAQLGSGRRDKLLATDIDARILEKARAGEFTNQDMKNVSDTLRRQYFSQKAPDVWAISDDIKRRVEFRRHDLLRDRFDRGFNLILCRNVVIYFTDGAKDKLYKHFYESLAPGGILFVGGTERIMGAKEIGFEVPKTFFYQRPG
ncbi:MAG: chemotaxis protein CheR [Armatimonadia bacterium]|nr:chemotaxis protein CheR [Armatimonadia bacterium]